jgi:hypothetical protein
MNVVRAAHVVTALAYFGLAALVLVWLGRYLDPWPAAEIGLLLCLDGPNLELARGASPDGLAALLQCAGIYLYLEKGSRLGLFSFLTLAVLARHDAVLVGLSFAAYLFLFGAPRPLRARWIPVAAAAVLLGVYGLLAVVAPPYGWSILFRHTFTSPLPHPAAAAPVGLHDYLAVLSASLKWNLPSSRFLLHAMVLVLGAAFYLRNERPRLSDPLLGVPLVLLAHAALREIVFPAFFDRFFLTHYVVFTVAAVAMVRRRVSEGGAAGLI